MPAAHVIQVLPALPLKRKLKKKTTLCGLTLKALFFLLAYVFSKQSYR